MKKIFLLASSLFLVSCKFDAEGTPLAFIYPDEGIANLRTITKSCPIEVSTAQEVSLKELAGWVCTPPDRTQKIRRAYEKECGKNLQAAPQEENLKIFLEELDVNTKLWFSKATN